MPETDSKNSKYGSDVWDDVRLSFSTSLMVDTKLKSLSQNLEITEWPIKGSSETPSKYIDFTYEELLELPGLADKPERIDLLVDILRETMAFDDPFGDMVATVDAATKKEDNLGKNLDKVGIPRDFPIPLTHLSKDTKSFCKAEDITDLDGFAKFSQNMAENVVMGGDFKEFLSAINHLDENTLAKFLPFRPRHTGLHLQESVALILDRLSENERLALLKRYGKKLQDTDAKKAASINKDQLVQLETIIKSKVAEQCAYFEKQVDSLYKSQKEGITLERYFMVLDNPDKELISAKIMAQFLKDSRTQPGFITETSAPKKKGLFSRIFGRG